ncbi:Uncharacterized protein dnm_006720 [Desulfonema magnum]|uniref:Uncharacterized protein n=1 Tax=Desulfonema magnum TaxID=45655 RepID=A0A975GLC3_9BACT|nr:Uncharacterized protein dnm_006720 [Desulfonema magnum]
MHDKARYPDMRFLSFNYLTIQSNPFLYNTVGGKRKAKIYFRIMVIGPV